MCQGILIEDCDYNKTNGMFEVLTSLHIRDNDDIESSGYRAAAVPPDTAHSTLTLPGIAGSSYRAVGF